MAEPTHLTNLTLITQSKGEENKYLPELIKSVKGKVVTRDSCSYHIDRLNWDPYTSHHPLCIVFPISIKDIITCIYWALIHDIKFRIRGNHGHSLGYDFSSVHHGLVCNIKNFNSMEYKSRMNTELKTFTVTESNNETKTFVAVEPHSEQKDNLIVVGTGNVIGDVVNKLAQDGFIFPYGNEYGVGVGGIVQGGGIGLQTKYMGLCSDNLVECKLVTVKGETLKVSCDSNPDLFWAVRGGGGGNFGVITEMTLRCVEAPKLVTLITIDWKNIDVSIIKEIIVEWMVTNVYSNPDICRRIEINKRTGETHTFNANVTCIIYNGDESLFKFKNIASFVKTVTVAPYSEIVTTALEPSRNDVHSSLNIVFLGYFTDQLLEQETIDLITEYFSQNDSDIFMLELGGNFAKKTDETAFPWRNAKIYFEISKIWPVYKHNHVVYCRKGKHRASLCKTDEINEVDFTAYEEIAIKLNKKYNAAYVNVPNNTYKTPQEYERAYYGKNRHRLRVIKTKYDKDNFFNFSQSIKGKCSKK